MECTSLRLQIQTAKLSMLDGRYAKLFMEARFLVLKSKEIMKTYILGSHKYYLKKTRLNMKTLQNSGEISIKRLFFRIT